MPFNIHEVATIFPHNFIIVSSFVKAPAFYWELEICSFGDSQEESGAVISFGFAPSADKKDGAWTNPVGTCLFLKLVLQCLYCRALV